MFHKMICFTFMAILIAVSVPALAFDLFGDSFTKAPKDGTVSSFEIRLVHKKNEEKIALLKRAIEKGNSDAFKENMPDGSYYRDVNGKYFFLEKKILFNTQSLNKAHYSLIRHSYIDGQGRTTYAFTHQLEINLSQDGTVLFADFTKKNKNRKIAVFVNGYLIGTPVINGTISNGRFTVSSGKQGREIYKAR